MHDSTVKGIIEGKIDKVLGGYKGDAPAADWIYVFTKKMYNEWWVKRVRRLITEFKLSWATEYQIFYNLVHQTRSFMQCIVRCSTLDSPKLQCWDPNPSRMPRTSFLDIKANWGSYDVNDSFVP
jgi:hypothetical protein